MMSLAVYHDCARRLGLDPVVFFDEAAAHGPERLATLVRGFGRRTDDMVEGFHFEVADTPDGPKYERTHKGDPLRWRARTRANDHGK